MDEQKRQGLLISLQLAYGKDAQMVVNILRSPDTKYLTLADLRNIHVNYLQRKSNEAFDQELERLDALGWYVKLLPDLTSINIPMTCTWCQCQGNYHLSDVNGNRYCSTGCLDAGEFQRKKLFMDYQTTMQQLLAEKTSANIQIRQLLKRTEQIDAALVKLMAEHTEIVQNWGQYVRNPPISLPLKIKQ